MLGLDLRLPLLGHVEQRPDLPFPLLGIPGRIRRPLVVQVLGRFDLQRLFRQHLHDLKGQEAEDVNHVVVGSAVRHDPEAGPFAESLGFAEGEGGLPAFGPVDVLFFGHVSGAFVGAG